MPPTFRFFDDFILAQFTAYIQRRWIARIEAAKNPLSREIECRDYWFAMIMLDKLSWVCFGADRYKKAMTTEMENVRWYIYKKCGCDPHQHKDFVTW